jgi:hypothetical protein
MTNQKRYSTANLKMFAELLNSIAEIAHMFVETSAADFVCGSPFRFQIIRNSLLNAPALRVRPGAP